MANDVMDRVSHFMTYFSGELVKTQIVFKNNKDWTLVSEMHSSKLKHHYVSLCSEKEVNVMTHGPR